MPRSNLPRSKRGAGHTEDNTIEAGRESEAFKLVKTLASDETDVSRLLELYYWTREPGIVELIRTYLDLPERTQRTLSTFLLNGRPKAITGSFDPQGRLVLARAPSS